MGTRRRKQPPATPPVTQMVGSPTTTEGGSRQSFESTKVVRDSDGNALSTVSKVITAAAAVYASRTVRQPPKLPKTGLAATQWQQELWDLYDQVGELRFATNWQASAASRARLICATIPADSDGNPEAVKPGGPDDMIDDLGSQVEQAQLIRRAVQHLSLPGETYLVAQERAGRSDAWSAQSNDEITYDRGANRWAIDDGSGKVTLPDQPLVIRAWNPHPRIWQWADSAARAALPVVKELRGLTMHVSAQIDSRLASAGGILIVPNSLMVPDPPNMPADVDPFMWTLIDTASTAISDRDSAAALVPIVVRVPDELTKSIEFLRLDSPLDEKAKELRDEAIRRLGLSLDMPPEVLLGLGDTNHWSGWRIGEDALRYAVEPALAVLAHALTIGWYRPALEEAGMSPDDAAERLIWFDLSALEVRADRSTAAVELYDRGELTGDALRRENAFSDKDKPNDDERRRVLLIKAALNNPSAVDRVLALLAGEEPPPITISPPNVTREEDPDTAPDGDNRDLPSDDDATGTSSTRTTPATTAAALGLDHPTVAWDPFLFACHVAVLRALDVAGKRMLEKIHDPQLRARREEMRRQAAGIETHLRHTRLPVDTSEMDRLLAGAWDSVVVAFPDAGPCLASQLDDYTRALIEGGEPHHIDYLRRALDKEPCYAAA